MTELDRGPSLPDESPIIVQEMAAIESSATEASEGPEREFTVAARSQFRIVLRRFLHHKLAVVSLVILILLFFMSLFGGAMWKYRPTDETNDLSAPPSLSHPMGTDSSGHDYYALVLAGAQKSVEIALIVAVVTGVVGTAIGAIAGYYGGFTDSVLMRITDLFLVVPELVIFALLANKFASAGWEFLALSLAGVLWVYAARVIRGVFISLREKDYVEAARALGASNRRIIFRHLLPNATGPIIVNITVITATAVLLETSLSYLGLGVRYPDTSLGSLISIYQEASTTRPWLFYFPGVLIVLICLTVNFVGDGLRDAFDPGSRRVRA